MVEKSKAEKAPAKKVTETFYYFAVQISYSYYKTGKVKAGEPFLSEDEWRAEHLKYLDGLIDEGKLLAYANAIHDKDVLLEDTKLDNGEMRNKGEAKPTHMHDALRFSHAQSKSQVMKLVGASRLKNTKPIPDMRRDENRYRMLGELEYLTHDTDKAKADKKHKYPRDMVVQKGVWFVAVDPDDENTKIKVTYDNFEPLYEKLKKEAPDRVARTGKLTSKMAMDVANNILSTKMKISDDWDDFKRYAEEYFGYSISDDTVKRNNMRVFLSWVSDFAQKAIDGMHEYPSIPDVGKAVMFVEGGSGVGKTLFSDLVAKQLASGIESYKVPAKEADTTYAPFENYQGQHVISVPESTGFKIGPQSFINLVESGEVGGRGTGGNKHLDFNLFQMASAQGLEDTLGSILGGDDNSKSIYRFKPTSGAIDYNRQYVKKFDGTPNEKLNDSAATHSMYFQVERRFDYRVGVTNSLIRVQTLNFDEATTENVWGNDQFLPWHTDLKMKGTSESLDDESMETVDRFCKMLTGEIPFNELGNANGDDFNLVIPTPASHAEDRLGNFFDTYIKDYLKSELPMSSMIAYSIYRQYVRISDISQPFALAGFSANFEILLQEHGFKISKLGHIRVANVTKIGFDIDKYRSDFGSTFIQEFTVPNHELYDMMWGKKTFEWYTLEQTTLFN